MGNVHTDPDIWPRRKGPDQRFSPMNVRGFERVRGHGFDSFWVASALGSTLKPGHNSGADLTARDWARGVKLTTKKRDVVLSRLGHRGEPMSMGRWRNLVGEWVRLRMAHRCADGSTCLFVEPLDASGDRCPACGQELDTRTESVRANARKAWPKRTESVHDDFAKRSYDVRGRATPNGMQRGWEQGMENDRLTDDDVRALGYEPTSRGWVRRGLA